MVDPDILLLAIVNMAEGVKALVGDKGAKVVMRDAGRQSGPRLLESLIGQALRRSCAILEQLGFAKSIRREDGKIVVEEATLTPERVERGKIIYVYS